MQIAFRSQVLDGHEFGAIDLAQQEDTGIDGLVMHMPVPHAAERNGACAAIALGAAFLGTDLAFLKSQVVQKRRARVKARDLYDSSLAQKADRFSCHYHPPPVTPGSLW
ncbi:hypothetical protein MAE02_11580 [Microvirga aerophila]|uniref:Uncharacterized protein n=1 Tax=Microvirga aerophila TaxID=670291 RepID=A0A512BNB8_9HYPH|nr:hypothetical protein MAE02_11580 [Microvirga aerophila]